MEKSAAGTTGGNAVPAARKNAGADWNRGEIPGFFLPDHPTTKTGKTRS